MTDQPCPREEAVVNAALTHHWMIAAGAPATVHDDRDGDLRAHLDTCESCADAALVAAVLRDDGADARIHARLPGAGQVWWRAAVRSRLESAQAATRPMTWMHGIAGALLVGAMLAVVGSEWPAIRSAAEWAFAQAPVPESGMTVVVVDAVKQSAVLAAAAVACLVLAPVAVYVALSGE